MTVHFTSDTHFGHANVIKYSKRPFKDATDMDEQMILRWNSVVKPQDTVYHLGDFAFKNEYDLTRILERLNGQKFLIYGNHDQVIKRSKDLRKFFRWCRDYYELSHPDVDGYQGFRKICLFHFPMVSWNKMHHGAWHLHGHCHHNLRYPFVGRIMDAGVDGMGYNYTPISFDFVKKCMDSITQPQFLDHHGN
jgi:calcineurin-like phosphoesterase family protein